MFFAEVSLLSIKKHLRVILIWYCSIGEESKAWWLWRYFLICQSLRLPVICFECVLEKSLHEHKTHGWRGLMLGFLTWACRPTWKTTMRWRVLIRVSYYKLTLATSNFILVNGLSCPWRNFCRKWFIVMIDNTIRSQTLK